MSTKYLLVAFCLILIQFNQPILAEDGPIYYKPECNGTEPKWTVEIENKCGKSYDYRDLINEKFENCKIQLRQEMRKVCCEGLIQIDEDKCVIDCPKKCTHGECDDNQRCSCTIGFGGQFCDTPCSAGHFGPKCEHNCECLVSRDCNPNYQHCKCDDGSITAECENICKCRFNLCNPGRIGRNCSVSCPDGTYGQFCSRTCSCIEENTRECVKESGDCMCKDRFYGRHCERKCTGSLKCENANVCKCVLTREQQLELVNQEKDNQISNLIVCLFWLTVLLCVASFLVHRYKIKSKLLKKENYSLRYSSSGKVTVNPISVNPV